MMGPVTRVRRGFASAGLRARARVAAPACALRSSAARAGRGPGITRYGRQSALAILAAALGAAAAGAMAIPHDPGLLSAGLPTITLPTVTVHSPPSVPGFTTPAPPPAPGSGHKKPPPSSGPGPLPPLGPYVHFSRVTYTDTPSSNDSKLQILIVQASYAAKKYVAAVHARNPTVKVLVYQSPWLRPSSDPVGQTTCLAGKGSYPASWFMYSALGRRQAWHQRRVGATYQMDFANPGYRRACARHAVRLARSMGADGVFMDGLATSLHWAQLPAVCVIPRASAQRAKPRRARRGRARRASATCASNARWQSTMTSALAYLRGQLHGHHLLLMGNIGGGNVNFLGGGGSTVWERYDQQLDGAMEESWSYGTDGKPVSASRLAAGLQNVAWAEAHGKYSILNDDIVNCPQCSGYGMAALLLVGQKLSSYDISNGSYGSYSAWWNQYYDKGQRLGNALGSYYTQPNGLLVRRFSNGTVVVNAATRAVADPAFGRVPANAALIH
jgi:hypothetical protein